MPETTVPTTAVRDERSSAAPYLSSVRLPVAEVVQFLVEVMGRRIVLHLAGVSDPQAVGKWAAGERNPRIDAEKRLRTAYRAFQTINSAENEHAARAWFIGLNPQLDDETPADAMASDRLRDVIAAAEAFVRTS